MIYDKFCLVSSQWNSFIENCQKAYVPGPYITIDEQLLPCKARCRFIQYMPNKPDKFGIKFWMGGDVHLTKTDYKVVSSAFLGDERNVVSKKKKPKDSTSKHDMAKINKNRNETDDEMDYTKTSKRIKESDVNKRQMSQKLLTSNISTLNISPKRTIQSTSSPSDQHVLLAASLCKAGVDAKQNFKKSNSSKSKNI